MCTQHTSHHRIIGTPETQSFVPSEKSFHRRREEKPRFPGWRDRNLISHDFAVGEMEEELDFRTFLSNWVAETIRDRVSLILNVQKQSNFQTRFAIEE